MNRALPRIVAVLLTICILMTGCWNSREMTDMSIVVGMGIDALPDSDGYRVTFQIVNSAALPSGSKSGGSGALPTTVYYEEDTTLFGALRKMSRKVPRRLFFGHIQLVVIGEALARKGISDLFDFFERSHEVRMNSTVLISRGATAEEVIKIATPLEKTPSVGIVRRTRITSRVWAESMQANINDVVNGLVSPGDPVISGIEPGGDLEKGGTVNNTQRSEPFGFLKVKGVSLFRDGKLIGWLDGPLARGVLWIRNQMKSTVVNLPCAENKTSAIVVVRSLTSLKPKFKEGKPEFDIHIKEEGTVIETQCTANFTKRESIYMLEQAWSEATKKEVMATVKEAQRRRSDILGFGSSLEQSTPQQWKAIEREWPAIYPDCKVNVTVEAYIRRTGMRDNSYLNELEQERKKTGAK